MNILYTMVLITLLYAPFCLPLKDNTLQTIFTQIYNDKKWGPKNSTLDDSLCEDGSRISSTKVIRKELPNIIKFFSIHTLLDIPCGDWHWMKEMDLNLDYYYGADIVQNLVLHNQLHYGSKKRLFLHLDATSDNLPCTDAVLCRDCLSHLSFQNIKKVIQNFKKTGITYLIVSNYNKTSKNIDIQDGDWHPINLLLPPFNFPQPLASIDEQIPLYPDQAYEKHLMVWRLGDITIE